jgi:hypothetical protein
MLLSSKLPLEFLPMQNSSPEHSKVGYQEALLDTLEGLISETYELFKLKLHY